MNSRELRKKYLEFFKSKNHQIIPSASLVPENDPTVLFTTAGMHPLVPFLMGENHPEGKRLVNVQKCVRTGDIDDVGDSTHNTFFEMLGNWSLGDYFKEDSIRWSWEFLTDQKWLGISPKKIKVTVFKGDEDASRDEESIKIWQKCFNQFGIDGEVYDERKKNNETARIFPLPKEDNWWGPAGETGPCGPDTEIFVDLGKSINFEKCPNGENCKPGCSCGRYFEFWNNVFMQYNKKQKVMLIDGMNCLYNKNFNLNKELLELINSYKNKKILVVNAFGEKAKELLKDYDIDIFTFEKKIIKENKDFFVKLMEKYELSEEEIFYIDHNQNNLNGAEQAGIENTNLFVFGDKIDNLKNFIDSNIYIFQELKQKNIDTGMGLERALAVLNGFNNVYETDILKPIIEKIEELSGKKYDESESVKKSMRIITDHLRTVVFMILDGVEPSNTDRGYILRRLLRRAIRHGNLLKMPSGFLSPLAEIVIEIYKEFYLELEKDKDKILQEIKKEEEKFGKTLERGLKEFKKMVENYKGNLKTFSLKASTLFDLYQTYGFPVELSFEEINRLREENIGIKIPLDRQDYFLELFQEELKKHQELSRTASAGKFKGGMADAGEETKKLHTAAHLLLESLRRVLGKDVYQKGSNITAERLRFDFSYPEKMTDEQKIKVENLVNEQIQKKLSVDCEEMSLDEAKKINAMGVFENKYGAKVKVYTIGKGDDIFSREICGGPHIENTSELGKFKIKKEQSSSAGVRRIKAILG